MAIYCGSISPSSTILPKTHARRHIACATHDAAMGRPEAPDGGALVPSCVLKSSSPQPIAFITKIMKHGCFIKYILNLIMQMRPLYSRRPTYLPRQECTVRQAGVFSTYAIPKVCRQLGMCLHWSSSFNNIATEEQQFMHQALQCPHSNSFHYS